MIDDAAAADALQEEMKSLVSRNARIEVLPLAGGLAEVARANEFKLLKRRIHSKLVDKLDLTRVGELDADDLRREIRLVVEFLCDKEETFLNRNEVQHLTEEVLDETFGLGPLEALLKDESISDILINGPKKVYVEHRGKMKRTSVEFFDNAHLLQIIDRIVSKVGRRVDETSPMVDARLQDGSRVNAIIPPLALDGPAVSIRRFGAHPLKLADLLKFNALTPEMAHTLGRMHPSSVEHHSLRRHGLRENDAPQHALDVHLE